MAPLPIENVVFVFEGLLPELDSPPIAARRGLDHAGLRLSLESWRSLSLDERERVTVAGADDEVEVEHVLALAKSAMPPPQRVKSVPNPDPTVAPEALVRALEPTRRMDPMRWMSLRALDRYALVHTHRRAVARSDFSLFIEVFDAVLGGRPLSPLPRRSSRPPHSVRVAPALPGFYSQNPSDARAVTVAAISSHLNAEGEVHMVDVGSKSSTHRRAVVAGSVHMRPETARRLAQGETPKGDVLATARVAAIMAAKKASELIPLCHPVTLTKITVDLDVDVANARLDVRVTVEAHDRTGVEMEAMTAASVACLTIYDMLKGIDRAMTVTNIRLMEKTGGKTGAFRREERT